MKEDFRRRTKRPSARLHAGVTALTFFLLCACLLLGSTTISGAAPTGSQYANCARVCGDCSRSCHACANHCRDMVKSGMKEHVLSERLCEDSTDITAATAKVCARKGPMAVAQCEACLKSCTACAAECHKYPDMPIMATCAKACDACDAACKQMIGAGAGG